MDLDLSHLCQALDAASKLFVEDKVLSAEVLSFLRATAVSEYTGGSYRSLCSFAEGLLERFVSPLTKQLARQVLHQSLRSKEKALLRVLIFIAETSETGISVLAQQGTT